MLFWLKKKTVVLDCFTNNFPAHDRFKIDKASKFLPAWYKELGNGNPYVDPEKPLQITMKKCVGFLDYFKNSFALPSWDYLHFRVDHNDVGISAGREVITSHPQEHYGNFLDSTYKHFKITPPWLIHANNKVKFIQTFSPWVFSPKNNPEKILHLPGVVDFYYQNSTNVNMFIRTGDTGCRPSMITLEPGTPLVFFTPLNDSIKITFKHHLLSTDEFNQRINFLTQTTGINRLKINRQYIDKRDQEKKCPFGFGK